MITDFVDEFNGYLRLNEEERIQISLTGDNTVPQIARELHFLVYRQMDTSHQTNFVFK